MVKNIAKETKKKSDKTNLHSSRSNFNGILSNNLRIPYLYFILLINARVTKSQAHLVCWLTAGPIRTRLYVDPSCSSCRPRNPLYNLSRALFHTCHTRNELMYIHSENLWLVSLAFRRVHFENFQNHELYEKVVRILLSALYKVNVANKWLIVLAMLTLSSKPKICWFQVAIFMVGNGTGNARKFVLHVQHNYFSFFNKQYSCFVALSLPASREFKHATFLSHGRQPEMNISHASLRFLT